MSETWVTNWAGTVAYEARERYAPTNVEQVQQLVRDAGAAGRRVRVVGTRHTFNDLTDTDGVHLSLRSLPRVLRLTPEGDGAVIDGGAT